jgi:hypothetical protein
MFLDVPSLPPHLNVTAPPKLYGPVVTVVTQTIPSGHRAAHHLMPVAASITSPHWDFWFVHSIRVVFIHSCSIKQYKLKIALVTLLFNDALLSTNHLNYTPNCSAMDSHLYSCTPCRPSCQAAVCTSVWATHRPIVLSPPCRIETKYFQKLQHKEKVKTFMVAQCLLSDKASRNEQRHAVQLTDIWFDL